MDGISVGICDTLCLSASFSLNLGNFALLDIHVWHFLRGEMAVELLVFDFIVTYLLYENERHSEAG